MPHGNYACGPQLLNLHTTAYTSQLEKTLLEAWEETGPSGCCFHQCPRYWHYVPSWHGWAALFPLCALSPTPIGNFSLHLPRQTWPRSMVQDTPLQTRRRKETHRDMDVCGVCICACMCICMHPLWIQARDQSVGVFVRTLHRLHSHPEVIQVCA